MENDFEIDIEQELLDDKEHDSKISRCLGLLAKSALKKIDNKTVYAENVYKDDGPFYCPVCLSEAVVRKCTEKKDHFAHHARQSPIIKSRDTILHTKCRDQILAYMLKVFPDGKWEKEREIPANKEKGYKKIIPDISGRIGDIPVAIEVQASAYTVKRISTKIVEYQKRNPKVAVLYIVPLTAELGNEPFRPRLFEKYLHSIYYGRVYYWLAKNGFQLQPVHYSPAKRWIEATTWFDVETKEERSEGGFWLTFRTVKIPNYGETIDITTDFSKTNRPAFEPKNVKKAIPEGTIFQDKLKKWWPEKEFENIEKQFTIFKEKPKPHFIDNYEYFDDYDEEN